jgi:hypothetical protein
VKYLSSHQPTTKISEWGIPKWREGKEGKKRRLHGKRKDDQDLLGRVTMYRLKSVVFPEGGEVVMGTIDVTAGRIR